MADDKSKPSPEGEVGSLEKSAEDMIDAKKGAGRFDMVKRLTGGMNLYLIAFGVIVLVGAVITYIAVTGNQNEPTISVTGDEINQEIIDELKLNETRIGDVTQTLTVEANAIFNGRILVKDNLDVAGSINVGGPLTLPGITVSGSSQFDDVEITGALSILGNAGIVGTLSVQDGISVTGSGSFTGDLSADSISVTEFELLGDLVVSRHIDTGGPTPTSSSGGSVGTGGTTSVSGTDVAGTVTVNTGTGASSGLLATINFRRAYTSTPTVVVTPIGSDSAGLDLYITRSSTQFRIYVSNAPSDSSALLFDYIVIE